MHSVAASVDWQLPRCTLPVAPVASLLLRLPVAATVCPCAACAGLYVPLNVANVAHVVAGNDVELQLN